MKMSSFSLPRFTPRHPFFLIASLACLFISGCIPDQMFQRVSLPAPSLSYPPSLPPLPSDVVTVEFNNAGELFQGNCAASTPNPCQLAFAEQAIQQARRAGDPTRLVVLVFVHGNRNNASMDADNYPHFLQLIECLNVGSDEYAKQLKSAQARVPKFRKLVPIDCAADGPHDRGVRFFGVYIVGVDGPTNPAWTTGRQPPDGSPKNQTSSTSSGRFAMPPSLRTTRPPASWSSATRSAA